MKAIIQALVSSNRSTGIIIMLVAAALKLSGVDVLPEDINALVVKLVAGAGACVSVFGIVKDVLRKIGAGTTKKDVVKSN